MIYSHKYKYIYLAPPKTGTRTIDSVLTKHFDGKYWDFKGIVPVRTTKNQPRDFIWPRHIIHVPKEISDYFIFASIRNPYHHTMSQYKHWTIRILKKETSLNDFFNFIENVISFDNESLFARLQRDESYNPPPTCVKFNIQQYIVTETLETDFNKLPFVKTTINLPVENEQKKVKLFYTNKMAQILLEKRKIDFEYFGFDKKVPEELKNSCLL